MNERRDTTTFNFVKDGANQEFYKPYLQDFTDEKKNFYPSEYRQFGSYAWIEVSDYWKVKIKDALLNVQTICMPTLSRLHNERNVAQIQERVYLKMKKYEDEFNNCHVQARNPDEAAFCAERLESRLRKEVVAQVKDILEEY